MSGFYLLFTIIIRSLLTRKYILLKQMYILLS